MKKLLVYVTVLLFVGCCDRLKKAGNPDDIGQAEGCEEIFQTVQSNWKPTRDYKPEEVPWYSTDVETIAQFKERKFDPCFFTLDKSGLKEILGKPTYDRETPKTYPSPPDLGYKCVLTNSSDRYVIWFHLDKETGLVRYVDPSKVHSSH